MKKHFYLLFSFCASGFISHAQIEKGQFLLGGDVNFANSNQGASGGSVNTSKATDISLNPSIGKAIKDNLVAGVDLNYTHNYSSETDANGNTSLKTDTYGAGIFLREYKSLSNRFFIFTQERVGANFGKTTGTGYYSGNGPVKTYNLSFAFYPGVAYGICKRVQLEAGLQNLFSVNYAHQSNSVTSFSVGTSLNRAADNITIGCQFLLGH